MKNKSKIEKLITEVQQLDKENIQHFEELISLMEKEQEKAKEIERHFKGEMKRRGLWEEWKKADEGLEKILREFKTVQKMVR